MAKGFGVAGLILAVLALFTPFVGFYVSILAVSLIIVAALAGDRIFVTAAALLAFVNTMFLSPSTWLLLASNDTNAHSMLLIAILLGSALPFLAMALNATGALALGRQSKGHETTQSFASKQLTTSPFARSEEAEAAAQPPNLTPVAATPSIIETGNPNAGGWLNGSSLNDQTFRFAALAVAGVVALSAIGVGGILGWKYLDSRPIAGPSHVPQAEGSREASPSIDSPNPQPVVTLPPPQQSRQQVSREPAAAAETELAPPPETTPQEPAPAPAYTPPTPTYAPPSEVAVPAPAIPPPQPTTAATRVSLWNHNGSMMVLIAEGDGRKFYYDSPRPGLLAVGVRNGTLLFEGRRRGNTYSGTAYLFSEECPPIGYAVTGRVLNGDKEVLLHGRAPRRQNCVVVEYVDDILRFTYSRIVQGYSFSTEGE